MSFSGLAYGMKGSSIDSGVQSNGPGSTSSSPITPFPASQLSTINALTIPPLNNNPMTSGSNHSGNLAGLPHPVLPSPPVPNTGVSHLTIQNYPESFGLVEANIYRSSILQPASFQLFTHLKTILFLSPETPTKSLLSFVEENKIQLINLGYQQLSRYSVGWRPVPEEVIKEGLETILNVDTHPIMVMCSSGVQETGVMIGCLRKFQGWDFNSIIVEYRSFAGNRSRYVNEQFIELFDLDLISLPKRIPLWLQRHQSLLERERLDRIRHPKSEDEDA